MVLPSRLQAKEIKMKHTCGGELISSNVKIKKKVGVYYQTFTVSGFKCNACGEEVIERGTALGIDRAIAQLKNVWHAWRIPSVSKATGTVSREQVFEDNNYVQV